MQTEFEFHLPQGFLDAAGQPQRDGCMRLATALDEVEALRDPRVQLHEAYLPIVLLSRVVIRLGELPAVTPQVIAGLFAADLAYLEDLYLQINSYPGIQFNTICPYCSNGFQVLAAPT